MQIARILEKDKTRKCENWGHALLNFRKTVNSRQCFENITFVRENDHLRLTASIFKLDLQKKERNIEFYEASYFIFGTDSWL